MLLGKIRYARFDAITETYRKVCVCEGDWPVSPDASRRGRGAVVGGLKS
jgi:hypothetical protein